ncbi:hypothetical protein POKO110462_10380 [Pontibacter korlensis]|uniref:Uncharacterized protein n=1 Tax=Pontibacter korlensis TaxID=400092 RepID=A0A0E3UUN1_9BACT|nr:hypothetical protein [Pontibacter korlensis]AKD01897.1 hypothetical protein PKOR_00480 [Pontibacter korlensis]
MKNNTFAAVLLLITSLSVYLLPRDVDAQYRPSIDVQEWPSGKVVLTSGDTIFGPITFYRTQEVVSVQNEDGTRSSFTPVNVQYFIAQEEPSGRSYTFRSLMWDMGRDYSDFKKPTFFEELNQGSYTLIMREDYIRKDPSRMSPLYANNAAYGSEYYVPGSEWIDQIKALYYVLLPNGEIVTLRNVRKDLHALFGNKSREVRKFVRERNLSYEKPHQLMSIISFYNSLI